MDVDDPARHLRHRRPHPRGTHRTITFRLGDQRQQRRLYHAHASRNFTYRHLGWGLSLANYPQE